MVAWRRSGTLLPGRDLEAEEVEATVMSEYQFIAFQSVDRALTDKEMEFAHRQSTRAEITPWSFRNEYHWSNFRGDVNGLLRHGYDVHLHYANFGIRTIGIRLPAGLPFPKSVWSPYFAAEALTWTKDRKGKGGIVSIRSGHDPGEIDEIWEPGAYVEDVAEMRRRLIEGDLRALYVLWLCAAFDEYSFGPDKTEPPVPGGLAECLDDFGDFLYFFGLDPLILRAAAEGAPETPDLPTREQQCREWVDQLDAKKSRELLRRFLSENAGAVRAETMAAISGRTGSAAWPTASLGRSLDELFERTRAVRTDYDAKEQKKREAAERRKAAKREKQRQERMKEMMGDPEKWLRKASKLVEARGTDNYEAAADILADVREAIGGDEGEKVARKHAAHLGRKHPTLNCMKSALRKRGLWS